VYQHGQQGDQMMNPDTGRRPGTAGGDTVGDAARGTPAGGPGAGAAGPWSGAWLRERRLARGWARQEMARRMHEAMKARNGAAPSVKSIARSIGGWEEGTRHPQDRWQAVSCEVLGVALKVFPPKGTGTSDAATAGLAPDDPSPWAQVARMLLELIGPGKLKPGDRMPSIGGTASQAGVSLTTARRAYTCLKDQEILSYSAGNGYYVSRGRPGGAGRVLAGAGDGPILEALLLAWGAEYGIACGPAWRAWRLDGTGEVITAPGPAELNAAIRADYVRWAVLPLLAAMAAGAEGHIGCLTAQPQEAASGQPATWSSLT
jgi:transcriptional regulator with XRE-family HTH domain